MKSWHLVTPTTLFAISCVLWLGVSKLYRRLQTFRSWIAYSNCSTGKLFPKWRTFIFSKIQKQMGFNMDYINMNIAKSWVVNDKSKNITMFRPTNKYYTEIWCSTKTFWSTFLGVHICKTGFIQKHLLIPSSGYRHCTKLVILSQAILLN